MAKRFLTHLDMSGNQILNASFEKLTTENEPTTGLFDGRLYYNTTDEVLKVYTTTDGWLPVGAITDIVNSDGNISVSVDGAGVATVNLAASITADVTGDLTGNADTATYATTAGTANAVAANSVALGTDTTGNYVQSISGDTNVVVTGGTGEGSTPSLSLAATISSDTSGNAATATYATTAGGVDPDSVALGTDTTGDYVATIGGTDGVSVSGAGTEGRAVTIANTDKGSSQNIFKTVTDGTNNIAAASNNDTLTVSGTANEVTVSASTGDLVIGLPNDVTIGNNLTVTGDLTVSGTTTTVNTETINLADNIITLNSNFTGATPTENAGLEVERGDLANVVFRWNETTDVWEATTDGTNYYTVLLSGQTNSPDIPDFTEAAQDAVGAMIADTATIDLTYTDGTPELKADVKLQTSNSYLTSATGLAVDVSTLEAKLVTDSFTKKAAANVGNGVNTSFAVTHNFGTRDVQVQVYDNATFDTVEVDVVRTDANNVTVSFATAPSSSAYRVVIIG